MAKRQRKEDPPPPGLPGWMATFSDMVTLLLTFFVMLMAMANFDDTQKMQMVMDSLNYALGVNGYQPDKLTDNGKNYSSDTRRDTSLQPILARLRQAMAKHVSDDFVRMSATETEIRVMLDDRVFFKPASIELHPAAYAFLTDVAGIVKDEEVQVKVEGHSDTLGDEDKNWQVSALRSLAVVQALRERGPVAGDKLEVSAFGPFRPASGHADDQLWNRRIEIVLRADDLRARGAIRELMQLGDSDGR